MSVSEGVKPVLCPQAEAALERLRVGLKEAAEDVDLIGNAGLPGGLSLPFQRLVRDIRVCRQAVAQLRDRLS